MDPSGMYVPIEVHSCSAQFLVDTGATITVLSKTFFDTLPHEIRTKLRRENQYVWLADNCTNIEDRGTIIVGLKIGDKVIDHKVHIVDIGGDAILGLDFLIGYGCKLDWKHGIFSIDQTEVQMVPRKKEAAIYRLVVTETTIVPSGNEALVQTKIVRKGRGLHMDEGEMLQTGLWNLCQGFSIRTT
ncbi:hypothetical protein BSL78_16535 [Apostichopus japonicus]|uniref:Peptidase A2 domain-containing protein n=1 Tax=Stichopus japonicus TaxID=307972 RepID=A0A2G8KF37_STIJA|nr:hypothetical protein BSL78_16535 [Apostichopus japonicus]